MSISICNAKPAVVGLPYHGSRHGVTALQAQKKPFSCDFKIICIPLSLKQAFNAMKATANKGDCKSPDSAPADRKSAGTGVSSSDAKRSGRETFCGFALRKLPQIPYLCNPNRKIDVVESKISTELKTASHDFHPEPEYALHG
ncbi:MAG: hypothetical protein IJ057_13420 [Bacteroidales bacterium]|nr:hypothetical protein [Bacteroidales bacterium]